MFIFVITRTENQVGTLLALVCSFGINYSYPWTAGEKCEGSSVQHTVNIQLVIANNLNVNIISASLYGM